MVNSERSDVKLCDGRALGCYLLDVHVNLA